jgi:hypothetical protein
MSSDPTSGDLGVGSVLNDRPTVTVAQHRHVSSVRVDAETVASGNQSTSIADAHVNAGVNTTISIVPSVEKKRPFVSVRKLMPPQFFKEGEDDEDLAIEEAEVPENSKTWWQSKSVLVSVLWFCAIHFDFPVCLRSVGWTCDLLVSPHHFLGGSSAVLHFHADQGMIIFHSFSQYSCL